MSKFTDHLWQDLAREHGPTLVQADRAEPGRTGRARVLRRPRVLAGSTLGLAGVGVALVLALGTSATPPALAVTRQGDGSALVSVSGPQGFVGANRKLAAMGIQEHISIVMASGPAPVSGPVTCTPSPSGTTLPTTVKGIVGTDNTQVIPSGNTGAGTWHLASCNVYAGTDTQSLPVFRSAAAARRAGFDISTVKPMVHHR